MIRAEAKNMYCSIKMTNLLVDTSLLTFQNMSTCKEKNANMQDAYQRSILNIKNCLLLEKKGHLIQDESHKRWVFIEQISLTFLNFGNLTVTLDRNPRIMYLLY